jgi:hypothetical protein
LYPESNPRFIFCSDIYKFTKQTSDPKNMDQILLKIESKTVCKIQGVFPQKVADL